VLENINLLMKSIRSRYSERGLVHVLRERPLESGQTTQHTVIEERRKIT